MGKGLKQKFVQTLRFLPALRLVWKSSPTLTSIRVVLVFVQGILPLATIYVAKLIIDRVTLNLGSTTAFEQILPLLFIAGFLTVITTLFKSFNQLVNIAHSQRVTDYMQGIIQAKSIEADLEYYENAKYHNALQRAQQEAPYRPPQILNRLAQTGQNGISLIAMIGLLISLHWGIMGVLIAGAIPSVLVKLKFSRVVYSWQRSKTEKERRAMYLNVMLTADPYAKEIRLFELGSFFAQWYSKIRKQLYDEKVSIEIKRFSAQFVSQSLAGILVFASFAYIIYKTLEGELLLGDLVLYYQALQRGQNNILALLTSISGLYEDNLYLANLYEFLDLKPKIIDSATPKAIPQPMQKGIVFESVGFQYAESSRKALKNINLTVKPGETIALVGENGSGKTTLIKLLCRLYDPTSGSITIDGINIRDFSISELRQQISVIFQDYAKYHFTAEENVRLGNIEIPKMDKNIFKAAMRSGAHDVISKLPQGYDTILGKLFEHGEELSIGQWQKIALARAFLRESQVIVLDEPTSAMDPKAEYEVFNKFRELVKDQAAILITHRLSTVKMADRIYVIDNGSIVESGSHEELLSLQGNYANLFNTQAQNYR